MKNWSELLFAGLGLIVATAVVFIIKKAVSPPGSNNWFLNLEIAAVSLIFGAFALGEVINLYQSVFKLHKQKSYRRLTWHDISVVLKAMAGSGLIWIAFSWASRY